MSIFGLLMKVHTCVYEHTMYPYKYTHTYTHIHTNTHRILWGFVGHWSISGCISCLSSNHWINKNEFIAETEEHKNISIWDNDEAISRQCGPYMSY